ncbi:MAG: hypothetical protein V4557_05630 [Bacteroidota bacterium]
MKTLRHSFLGKTVSAILFFSVLLFSSCSKDAEDAANSASQSPGNINGTWKATGGFIVKISGVSSSADGRGIVVAVGNSFPSTATGGECMSEVEYIRGGYWEAYFNTYFTSTGWKRGGVVGLAMNDAGTEFKIGSAVYVRQ